MGGEWLETTIGAVCEVYDGPHATPKKVLDGPIFLNISSLNQGTLDLAKSDHIGEDDFATWTRRVTPKEGDVVFSYETRLGEAAIIPAGLRCCLGRRLGLMRPDRNLLNPKYLLYAYLSPEFQSEIVARTIPGSTVDRIALKEFPNFPIRIPPLEIQEQIVDILSSLDDKIEVNRAINRTLEAMAQAIFKSWFVDFDPVKAKMAAHESGADPTRAAMAAISGKNDTELDAFQQQDPKNYERLRDTAEAFPNALVESELGMIPEGWGVGTIDQLIDFNPSRSLKKGAVAPYIEMKYMPTAGHTPELVYDRPFSGGAKFMNGDTLLARITPCLENGKTAYVDILDAGQVGWGSTEYIVMRTKVEEAPELSYFIARDDRFRAHAIRCMTGTSGRQRVEIHALKAYPTSMPSAKLLEGFGQIARDLMSGARHSAGENRSLAELRDNLLPKLLSGQQLK